MLQKSQHARREPYFSPGTTMLKRSNPKLPMIRGRENPSRCLVYANRTCFSKLNLKNIMGIVIGSMANGRREEDSAGFWFQESRFVAPSGACRRFHCADRFLDTVSVVGISTVSQQLRRGNEVLPDTVNRSSEGLLYRLHFLRRHPVSEVTAYERVCSVLSF